VPALLCSNRLSAIRSLAAPSSRVDEETFSPSNNYYELMRFQLQPEHRSKGGRIRQWSMSSEERQALVALGNKARWSKPSAHKRQSRLFSRTLKLFWYRYREMKAQLESQKKLESVGGLHDCGPSQRETKPGR
jgi:hypothetical protein